ncbi:MAG: bifunctional nicotinamide-nucleotide adenylyltransferase/Nudix hydroxylase [Clostridia bacterium]|jgi:bifunctional NMN adenylyltransferase/nudix hydrolase
MKKIKPSIGVFIGRFQPLHNAHLAVIKMTLEKVDHLIILLGSACQAKTIKNPWTSEEREDMIRVCLNKADNSRITIITSKDYLYNDNLWLVNLQSSLSAVWVGKNPIFGATPNGTIDLSILQKYTIDQNMFLDLDDCDVTLYGHDKDRSTFYLHLFPQWKYYEVGDQRDNNRYLDATKVRQFFFRKQTGLIKDVCPPPVFEKLYNEIVNNTNDYNRLYDEYAHVDEYKQMWKGSPFPPIFVTTDAVVIKSGHVLVGRRRGKLGYGLLALPGGFVRDDENLTDGCIRELKEETRIGLPKDELIKHIRETHVFDHPERSLRGRTITHAFCIDLGSGPLPKVKGDDDMKKARWMPLRDINRCEEEFFEDHWHIINYFTSRA